MTRSAPASVIAIAAPPGGGKTTLVRSLSARLGGVPVLHYDDYQEMTRRSVAEVEAWLDRGGPLAEILLPRFLETMLALKQGGARYVLVDFLLARAHPATAPHIDFVIWIDLPLDVALARMVRAQVALARQGPPAGHTRLADWLDGYLESYERFLHRSYEHQRKLVRPLADLVVDGTLASERLAELAAAAILARFP
jgi:uridine kinase